MIPFWLAVWLGIVLAGGVLGLWINTPLGFLVGMLVASVLSVPVLVLASTLTWFFWLTRFRILVAATAGGATGALASFAIPASHATSVIVWETVGAALAAVFHLFWMMLDRMKRTTNTAPPGSSRCAACSCGFSLSLFSCRDSQRFGLGNGGNGKTRAQGIANTIWRESRQGSCSTTRRIANCRLFHWLMIAGNDHELASFPVGTVLHQLRHSELFRPIQALEQSRQRRGNAILLEQVLLSKRVRQCAERYSIRSPHRARHTLDGDRPHRCGRAAMRRARHRVAPERHPVDRTPRHYGRGVPPLV